MARKKSTPIVTQTSFPYKCGQELYATLDGMRPGISITRRVTVMSDEADDGQVLVEADGEYVLVEMSKLSLDPPHACHL